MSPRKKTAPPPRDATARPGTSVRSSLIVKDKKSKRSAKEKSALDDRFHRTDLRFTGAGDTQNVRVIVTGPSPHPVQPLVSCFGARARGRETSKD